MLPNPPATVSNPLANFPGIPAVPQKLVQKIISREYFNLADLLPDQLLSSPSTSTNTLVVLPESAYATHRRKKRQIPDIASKCTVLIRSFWDLLSQINYLSS
jgi:hypothetical protein